MKMSALYTTHSKKPTNIPYKRYSGRLNPLLGLVFLVAIGLGFLAQQSATKPTKMPEFDKLIILPKTKSLGPVNFTAHNNQVFNESDLHGKWSILFFAFTNCPDICPSTLHVLKQVKENLVKQKVWQAFQLAMVTVDPERDTPERMSQYVPFFDDEFIGLRADLDYTTTFAKNLGVLFFKREVQENGAYDVDHGAALILVNPKGEFAGVIGAPHKKEELTKDLLKLGNYAIAQGTIKKDKKFLDNTAKKPTSQTASSTKLLTSNTAQALSVNNAWIRPAPPQAPAMAGYASITNNSNADIVIEDISSPLFDMTMIHKTVIEKGLAGMEHLDELEIKAGNTIDLAPMSTHIMLVEPKEELAIGSVVPVSLTLSNGTTFEFTLPIQDKFQQ